MNDASRRAAHLPGVACIVMAAVGCDGDALTPRVATPREEIVLEQCDLVFRAASTFRGTAGRWPADLADTTAAGETLVDLLPGGLRLENAWTGERTEPRPADAPPVPGAVRYAPIGLNGAGYRITGHGIDTVVARLDNIDELESRTLGNADIVQAAVELFAAATGGVYPSDASVDCTPGGDTVIDLLPGGVLLVNAFTGLATEPVNARAARPGEVGYLPIVESGRCCGYVITCAGEDCSLIHTIVRSCDGECVVTGDR